MRASIASTFALVASAFALEAPIAGYGVQDFEWEVNTSDGIVLVNGTIQAAQAEVAKHPVDTANITSTLATSSGLEKRTDFSGAHYICNNFPPVQTYLLWVGINYLRRQTGKPRNGPGPGNCGQVSCESKHAIWWCNDSNAPKELESFGSIADGAEAIIRNCEYGHWNHPFPLVGGQIFHSTGWNVIVRENKC